MKHADFYIGLEFLGNAALRWRCTDVGTRTILAIALDSNNPDWYQGPPYIARETVFDEKEIAKCQLTVDELIADSLREAETSGHPGYGAEHVDRMMESWRSSRYPHPGVLRFDRLRSDGEILHPYSGHLEGETWCVESFLPFAETYEVMPEDDFIKLPRATQDDVKRRSASAAQHEEDPGRRGRAESAGEFFKRIRDKHGPIDIPKITRGKAKPR